MDEFDCWPLRGDPVLEFLGVAPERFNLMEFELDQFAVFGGAEMFDGALMDPAQPSDQLAGTVAFNRAPLVLRWERCQAADTPLGDEPDGLGNSPGARSVSPGLRRRRLAFPGSRFCRLTCGANWTVITHQNLCQTIEPVPT